MENTPVPHPIEPNRPQSEIAEVVDLLISLDKLKTVKRRNPIATSSRRERTAEHSWHVALGVLLLSTFSSEDIDVGKAVSLAVVHDLPEAFVGDTFVYGLHAGGRARLEANAMGDLAKAKAHIPAVQEVIAWWREYENEASPEGRFVMAIDVIMPILLNFARISDSSWVRHEVKALQVRNRVDNVKQACPALAALAYDLIDQAQACGALLSD